MSDTVTVRIVPGSALDCAIDRAGEYFDGIMERFAERRAALRSQGTRIPDSDLLVGVTALVYDLTIISRHCCHFGRIPRLRIYEDQ